LWPLVASTTDLINAQVYGCATLERQWSGDHLITQLHYAVVTSVVKKSKGSPYSITEHRVPELIAVLGE